MTARASTNTRLGDEILRLKAYSEVVSADIEALAKLRELPLAERETMAAQAAQFDEAFRRLRREILFARMPKIAQKDPRLADYLQRHEDLRIVFGLDEGVKAEAGGGPR